MTMDTESVLWSIKSLSSLLIFVVGVILLFIAVLFVIDVCQSRDAIRRNYPVIGRFRHILSSLGEFFRQYFFAMDREEMPFNRAEREWVGRASSGRDDKTAFGSTRLLTTPGTPIFVNCPFPTLGTDATAAPEIIIGPDARVPYPAKSIVNISGMSYGSISRPAVLALSRGAKMAGCWLNTGEGGLSPYHLDGGCDIVFQIGTAKFGVRTKEGELDLDKLREVAAIPQVRMIELKLSQGAKPGKGGILPGAKVTQDIAEIRGLPQGADAISPNRHAEINNVGQLLDFIALVRETTGKPVGIKAAIGAYGWIDEMCEQVLTRGIEHAPDFISVDSGDGGTGAAPMALMDNVGLPISEALPMVVDILEKHGLKDRIKVIASGKLITPAEVAWAYCAGADFVVSARGFMFALGCIQALKCDQNTCPTGITTHDRRLQKGLDPADKAVRVKNFVQQLTNSVDVIAHSCGVSHPRELKRFHVRIVQSTGISVPLDGLHASPGRTLKGEPSSAQ